jgi:hypothetical protein
MEFLPRVAPEHLGRALLPLISGPSHSVSSTAFFYNHLIREALPDWPRA